MYCYSIAVKTASRLCEEGVFIAHYYTIICQ